MKNYLSWALALGIAAFGVGISGCGKEEAGSGGTGKPTPSASNKYIIGVVAKASNNAVFLAAHAGANDAAKELTAAGAKYAGKEIEIRIKTPPEENPARQAEAIEELTRDGANGILVSCSEAKTLTEAINRAVDKGVVVGTFDSDAPASKRLFCYGADDIECGKKVGKALAESLGGKDAKGVIAILAGNQAAPNLQNRVKGVREALKEYPGIKEYNNGNGVVYHDENAEAAAQKVQEIQRNNKDITGWAFVGGWPLFAQDALNWPAGSVKVVSVDALPAELKYVKSGHVEILFGQDCYGWGYKGVDYLMDNLVNKVVPASKITDKLQGVTKVTDKARDSVGADEYEKSWDKWLKK